MKFFLLSFSVLVSISAVAQEERDSVYKRCPLYITDTVTANNFFIEALPATIKVDRVKGDLTVVIQQRDQFFSLFFNERKLKSTKYKIGITANNNREVAAKYSFSSGGQVSYVNVSRGTVDVSFDKEKDMWRLKVNGMIVNMVERSVTYYRVRSDIYIH